MNRAIFLCYLRHIQQLIFFIFHISYTQIYIWKIIIPMYHIGPHLSHQPSLTPFWDNSPPATSNINMPLISIMLHVHVWISLLARPLNGHLPFPP